MCNLAEITIGDRRIKVAEIKKAYIENIIKCVPLCNAIDKVVLFGSALERRCTDSSDVDIAIFGKYPKSKMFKLKSYNDFVEAVVSYGELQDYDLLYYGIEEVHPMAEKHSMEKKRSMKDVHSVEDMHSVRGKADLGILQDIYKGEVLYERM